MHALYVDHFNLLWVNIEVEIQAPEKQGAISPFLNTVAVYLFFLFFFKS